MFPVGKKQNSLVDTDTYKVQKSDTTNYPSRFIYSRLYMKRHGYIRVASPSSRCVGILRTFRVGVCFGILYLFYSTVFRVECINNAHSMKTKKHIKQFSQGNFLARK